MKTLNRTTLLMLAALTTMVAACSTDNVLDDITQSTPGNTSSGGSSSATGELTTFAVSIDKTSAEPATTAEEQFPDADEDPLENNTFGTEVSIDLSNPVAKTENGVEITVRDGHVTANHGSTKQVCYVLSGSTSNGSFTVVGEKKYEVRLEGVSITNPDSAALNLLCSKRAYIVLGEGTANTLTDGTNSQNGHKGTLYCKGKLLFNGNGSLSVTANYNNGIHSADYIVFRTGNNVYVKSSANHGIKANDGIYINGGASMADARQSSRQAPVPTTPTNRRRREPPASRPTPPSPSVAENCGSRARARAAKASMSTPKATSSAEAPTSSPKAVSTRATTIRLHRKASRQMGR